MEHKYREIYALLKTPKIKLTPHIISLMLEFYGLDDEYELTEEMIEFSQIGLNKRLSKMTSDIKDAEQPAKMVLSRINSMKLTILYINNPRVIENITARIDLLEILYNEKYKEISPAVQHAKDILHKSMHALAKIKVIMQAHGVNFRQGGSHAFLYGRQNELNAKRFIIRKYGKKIKCNIIITAGRIKYETDFIVLRYERIAGVRQCFLDVIGEIKSGWSAFSKREAFRQLFARKYAFENLTVHIKTMTDSVINAIYTHNTRFTITAPNQRDGRFEFLEMDNGQLEHTIKTQILTSKQAYFLTSNRSLFRSEEKDKELAMKLAKMWS